MTSLGINAQNVAGKAGGTVNFQGSLFPQFYRQKIEEVLDLHQTPKLLLPQILLSASSFSCSESSGCCL